MPDSLVVVFLFPMQPPAVFHATHVQLIDHARNLEAQTETLPGGACAPGTIGGAAEDGYVDVNIH
jgi:hypothetical protein